MTPNEIIEQSKIAIGNLLQRASPLTKTVITAFDFKLSRTANNSNLSSSRFKVESLESCAEFLDIKLATADGNKIFTKATLASRIVSALFALLPSCCVECDEQYIVEFEPEVTPFFTCFKCFQGSHICEQLKTKHEAMAHLNLPMGMVWLCKDCHEILNPVEPRRSKSRHNSVHQHDPVSIRAGSNSVSIDSPLTFDSNLVTPVPIVGTEPNAEHLRQRLTEHVQSSQNDPEICKRYKVGKCPHGIRGNKAIEDVTCPYQHPQRCFKYCKFGSTGRKGCNKGTNCNYFHPVLCKFSVKNKECTNTECSFPHLVGTKRPKKEIHSGNNVKHERQHSKNQILNDKKTTSPQSQSHFLELRKMVEDMGKSFKDELHALKSTLYHQHPLTSPMMNLPQPTNFSIRPQQSQSMHPVFPTAWSTPQFSS